MASIVYEDGTKVYPEYYNLGYGFLRADKIIITSIENRQCYLYSAVDFGLLYIPVKVEGIFKTSICNDSKRLLGYNFYLLNGAPIASLYNYRNSLYETRLNDLFKGFSPRREAESLIFYDNSLPKLKELLRKASFIAPPIRETIDLVDFSEISEFVIQNSESLNALYECYERSRDEIYAGHLIAMQKTLKRGVGITTSYHK